MYRTADWTARFASGLEKTMNDELRPAYDLKILSVRRLGPDRKSFGDYRTSEFLDMSLLKEATDAMHKSNISTKEKKQYWTDYIQAVAFPFESNSLLNRFITNSNVTGAYGEAWIKSFAASMLPQFRISTGAIIEPTDKNSNLQSIPQCDIIIWDPSYFPAIFERGEFALVPIVSARAVIEVKRSCDSAKKFDCLQKQLGDRQNCLNDPYRRYTLGVVISHPKPLFKEMATPEWLEDEKYETEPAITRLLDSENHVDKKGFLAFIYFLTQIAEHQELSQRRKKRKISSSSKRRK